MASCDLGGTGNQRCASPPEVSPSRGHCVWATREVATATPVSLRPSWWLPANRVAATLFHNRVMRIRPLPGYPVTLWHCVVVAVLAAGFAGLATYLHFYQEAWAQLYSGRPILVETCSIAGWAFEFLLVLILLPLNHNPNGLFPYLCGSSWEYLLVMHKRAGDVALVVILLHVATATAYYSVAADTAADAAKEIFSKNNILGWVTLAAFIFLRLCALRQIRRRFQHEIFYVVHVTTATAMLVLMTVHVQHRTVLWIVLASPLTLLAVDIGWRAWTSLRAGRAFIVGKVVMEKSHATALKIQMEAPFSFQPGQWALLCVPAVSWWQFHPFSLLSSSIPAVGYDVEKDPAEAEARPTVMVIVKTLGDWTSRLELEPFSSLISTNICVQGPLGRTPIDLSSYPTVVLVGAGCAVAPATGHAQRLYLSSLYGSSATELETSIDHPLLPNENLVKTGGRCVFVILTVQFRDMYFPLVQSLSVLAAHPAFRLHLFETGPNGALYDPATHVVSPEDEALIPLPISIGLPDIASIFAEIQKCNSASGPVAVMVAGPKPVQKAVLAACQKNNFTLNIEADSW
eukprot:TRINITY_DN10427_c0_g1_i1.p1 TRINITY_DN10427_c0_g1~~TRINITY_DN10427_c0_g1_i1.p1  ORF type:complete len:573 (+),score=95.48 TRINITY_DN10427_c0_g1_i1:49-1767(+)